MPVLWGREGERIFAGVPSESGVSCTSSSVLVGGRARVITPSLCESSAGLESFGVCAGTFIAFRDWVHGRGLLALHGIVDSGGASRSVVTLGASVVPRFVIGVGCPIGEHVEARIEDWNSGIRE